MRNLEKMVLSDNEVMDVKAMKAVVGGQVIDKSCRNTGTSSGLGGGVNVVCSGECPVVQPGATGTSGPNISKKCTSVPGDSMNGKVLYYCDCV